ncbi:MAG: glycosyltransferase family 61 protein [Pseudomonadota bacterium]|nr:glycosyltransferase family 61 protein [Pseudomonadota bacterium]
MKSETENPVRRNTRGLLHWFEDRLTIKPENGPVDWRGQEASRRLLSFEQLEKSRSDPSEPNWLAHDRVVSSGVCKIRKASVWMMCPSAMRTHDPQRRLAIIFKGLRRLGYSGSPRIFQYCLRHDEWRHVWAKRRKGTYLDGRVAILGNAVSDYRNYYHFWADTIADIWFLRQLLPESQMPQRYLMAYGDLPWQRQVLSMCGIPPEKIIPFSQHEWLSVETLIFPVRNKGAMTLPPWLATAIRSIAGWKGSQGALTRRIYLSRADAPRRGVANETQIRERLRAQGFEVLTLDGLSVQEQQELFASAAVIFSPHGAALTNLVWCSPGALVVDFISESHLKRCFRDLAWQSEVHYHPVVCRQVDSDRLGIDADIEITASQINAAIDLITRKDIITALP